MSSTESRLRRLEQWLHVPSDESGAFQQIARTDRFGGIVAESLYHHATTAFDLAITLEIFDYDDNSLYEDVVSIVPRRGETVAIETKDRYILGTVGQVTWYFDKRGAQACEIRLEPQLLVEAK